MQTQANGKEGLGQRIKAQLLGYVSKGVAFLKHKGVSSKRQSSSGQTRPGPRMIFSLPTVFTLAV